MMLRISVMMMLAGSVFMMGCSAAQKARKEQRDKIASTSGMYCDFVNGELFPADVEVALNLEMAKKCDSGKGFSLTQYKTPAENNGIVYCCSMSASAAKPAAASAAPSGAPASGKKDLELE